MAQIVRLEVATSAPRTGLWCSTCSLPSVVEQDVFYLCPEHAAHPLGTVACCVNCGFTEKRASSV